MSNRLVKNGMGLIDPAIEEVYVELVISNKGIKLKSPLPPAEVCKLLSNLSIDLMFQHFQPKEVSKIEIPT